MFRVKICGVRSVNDVENAVSAGADAVGFNFVAASRRYLDPVHAAPLAAAGAQVARVGVFVDAPPIVIDQIVTRSSLTHVQFHGNEGVDVVSQLNNAMAIRAFRLRTATMAPLNEWHAAADGRLGAGWRPEAYLLDAYAPDAHGGTGLSLPWQSLELTDGCWNGVPVILAGGLTPENVREAIVQARPAAVDVASGVEREPGVQDDALVRRFVENALSAFDEIS